MLVVLGPWRGTGSGSVTAQAACLLATARYGAALVHLRRRVVPLGLPVLSVATVQVVLAAVVMLLLAPVVATEPVDLTPRVVAAVLALGVLGTGLAYVWSTNVVTGWGATADSTVTYLTPLVGVVLGVALLSEVLLWHQPVGAVVVVLGIAVAQGRLRHARRGR